MRKTSAELHGYDPKKFKWCPRCEQVKLLGAFARDLKRLHGVGGYCKTCETARYRAWSSSKAGRQSKSVSRKRYRATPWGREKTREANKRWRSTENGRMYVRRSVENWRKNNPEKAREVYRKGAKVYRKRNPEAIRARTALNHAIQRGKLKRGKCWCGKKAEAHIADFSKPLEVAWLCPAHNRGVKSGALGMRRAAVSG